MKQKGVYPYDYMDRAEIFNDKRLPPKDNFSSILTDEHISDDQYQHVQNVWNTFNLKSIGDYDTMKNEPFIVKYCKRL